METKSDKSWYAAYVKRFHEEEMKSQLELHSIDCYVPKETVIVKNTQKQVVALRGFIFLKISPVEYAIIKATPMIDLVFLCDKQTKQPQSIPDKQMQDFILLMDNPTYICDINMSEYKRGQRVRVTDGALKGIEGEYVRIAGDRRIVVYVGNAIAIATVFIHPSMIEKIE